MRPCLNIEGFGCPMRAGDPCRGEGEPAHCERARAYVDGRPEATGSPPPKFDAASHLSIKLLVLGCDYRGPATCGQGCNRSWVCLLGNGRPVPGTDAFDVTMRDCRGCVSGK